MMIRQCTKKDLSRICEIFIFNNRVNYYPIFKDPYFSFKELQVETLINKIKEDKTLLDNIYVYDDGIIKGFIHIDHHEIKKLYVDSFFQNLGIGNEIIKWAIEHHQVVFVWALQKNKKAIHFYRKYGFMKTGKKMYEDGTKEYLIELKRSEKNKILS